MQKRRALPLNRFSSRKFIARCGFLVGGDAAYLLRLAVDYPLSGPIVHRNLLVQLCATDWHISHRQRLSFAQGQGAVGSAGSRDSSNCR